ncbi:MAG: crossover junction endodeoxyribonuclease RuvC [Parcubacteria group bacterium LiPW_41]|nr:MAG: crossover junction endodeoxyribonuclease RuvC [Parcubacteria group bacterium LiPW_41]
MKILGIDPGTVRAGFGIIISENSFLKLASFGVLSENKKTQGDRLCFIRNSLISIIKNEKPDRAVVELLFFSKNQKTALLVSEARGVIIQTLTEYKIPVLELTPNQIKIASTGNGSASKNAVKKMLSLFLKTDLSLVLDDSTDAIAAAFAGLSKNGLEK